MPSKLPSRFTSSLRQGMASQPIPPLSCTSFFNWRKLLLEGLYAYSSALVFPVVVLLAARSCAGSSFFRAASCTYRRGRRGASRRNILLATPCVVRRGHRPRGPERASLPGPDAPHASYG